MVSLKDIANACGFSVSAVSKALNDQKDIGEKTKRLIKKTAKEMGYLPNSQARALKINKTNNLGVLFMDEAKSGLTHDYFSSVLESFKVTAESLGYDITFISGSNQRKDKMSFLEHCRFRGFDGIMIACTNFEDPEVKELIQSKIPIVTLDYEYKNRISVRSDNVRGIRDLLKYIHHKGHRRIAYIHGCLSSVVSTDRLESFTNTAKDLGLTIPKEYIKESQYRDVLDSERITEELLKLKSPPTCILYPDDYASYGGMKAIKENNLKIPNDISVAGYDGVRNMPYLDMQLTTIRQDTKQLGSLSALKLIELIENTQGAVIESLIVSGELIEGNTVKKL